MMVFVNQGNKEVRNLVRDDVDKGQVGTGTTAATQADTGLETAKAATDLAVITQTNTVEGITMFTSTYTLATTDPNDTYTEFVLRKTTAPVTDFTRIVYVGTVKTANDQVIIINRIYFEAV